MAPSPLELPRSVLGELLGFLDHRSVHQLEEANRLAPSLVLATGIWRSTVLKHVALLPELENELQDSEGNGWKRLACVAAAQCQRDRSLLLDVHACSSVDRACESPTNTLVPSRCWLSMQSVSDRTLSLRLRSNSFADLMIGPSSAVSAIQSLAEVAQIECGCETAACYWSSSPSPHKHSRDFIEYTTRADCLVQAVQVLPYRAFWHPDSPTFAPQSVSFAFYAPSSSSSSGADSLMDVDAAVDAKLRHDAVRDRAAVYESPVYTMVNDMQLHEFELPKKVWLARGSTFRLNLLGRYQRETFEMPPWIPADEQEPAEPPYYCCLSYVAALGVSLDYR
ncbi:hypothetical protein PybrP1_004720 [[Pythium] brassicae (nom. inval.)]|nr:hypothetical protein PybrP1_004720 [[Pythium] brassicae (nom. inval.)]